MTWLVQYLIKVAAQNLSFGITDELVKIQQVRKHKENRAQNIYQLDISKWPVVIPYIARQLWYPIHKGMHVSLAA